MADLTPEENLFTKLLMRIKDQVPEIRYIEQDLGQLENYDIRPAVSWPCCLIDLEEFKFSEAGNERRQIGEGLIGLRIGLVRYSDSNNLVPDNVRANALQYYRIEYKVHQALQCWNDVGFSRFLRRMKFTEKRDDDIRVRVVKYYTTYEENTTPVKTTIPRPNAVLGTGSEL
jgi:hypothetical protein